MLAGTLKGGCQCLCAGRGLEQEKQQVLLIHPPRLRGAATPLVSDGAILRLWEELGEGADPAEKPVPEQ